MVLLFYGQPGEGRRDDPLSQKPTALLEAQLVLCLCCPRVAVRRYNMRSPQTNAKVILYRFLVVLFHKFMAWTCPTQKYQTSMTGSARTGRACEFLPAPDAKELDTDPGGGGQDPENNSSRSEGGEKKG